LLIDRDLQLVDLSLVGPHCIGTPRVVLLLERFDCARQLLFDDAAHRQDAGANALHLGVELLVRVIAHPDPPPVVSPNIQATVHPKRPVM
jgi:hypothetical protein